MKGSLPARAVPFSAAAGSILVMVTLLAAFSTVVKRTGLFVLCCLGGPAKQGLQGRNGVGQERGVSSALNRELQRAIEPGEVVYAEAFGLPLPQAYPDHPITVLNLVVERRGVTLDVEPIRQRLQLLPGSIIDQLRGIQPDPGSLELVPAPHPFELAPYSCEQSLRGQLL